MIFRARLSHVRYFLRLCYAPANQIHCNLIQGLKAACEITTIDQAGRGLIGYGSISHGDGMQHQNIKHGNLQT